MSVTRAAHAEVIRGTTQDCLDALLDFESYPQWQSAVTEVQVRARDADGVTVAFAVDARVKTLRYVLRYHLDDRRLWWEYVGGDLKHIEGDYVFEDQGDGTTRATYSVGIDPGRCVPGPVKKVLVEVVMKGSVRELRRRVESGATIP
ncbi:MAG: hypothetical protein JWO02_4105 [Solirubrobacterales bacterium]|nr:hypothetical protein [Solirubrobacterales bacterium]